MAEDLWGLPQPVRRPRSALTVTTRQRLTWYVTSTPSRIVLVAFALAVAATIMFAHRVAIADAWDRALNPVPLPPATTVTSEPSPSPTEDPDKVLAISDARTALAEQIDHSTTVRDQAAGRLDATAVAPLATALTAAQAVLNDSIDVDELTQATVVLKKVTDGVLDQIAAVDASPSPAPPRTTVAPKPDNTGDSSPPKSTSKPKPTKTSTPKPTTSKTATYALSVKCTEPVSITFTATGGGTVTIKAGVASNSGSGKASLTVTSDNVKATATATGNVSLTYSWSGSATVSCN